MVLGSWLMACGNGLTCITEMATKIIAILSLLYMVAQLLGLSGFQTIIHTHFLTIADYIRLLLLALMLFTLYQGIHKQA